ncbi:MAG: signal peptide peptidase SppA [Gammaproteobacteria bacterium]|nr:signal peptide peptidase SppA [Gammaproteobacteria bacterium]NIR85704.1 signal peptide peptidase SppA [Gammaproteobacteria bacterium]NIR90237.1 signal peptide peptidase SppA [Gammaproteobacteria bacterium]NIU06838.1 signal peptide peptidase SppA [Gammaproteobacteria bacterium]NIV53771.1 signal peptide peptidase SppA [Gammaproteobacteria bacterium]
MSESEPDTPPGAQPSGEKRTTEPTAWERDLVNRLAFASLIEHRRTRRWGIFFKFLIFAYLLLLLVLYLPGDWRLPGKAEEHVALVDVQGLIAEGSSASAERIVTGLRAAFDNDNIAGVIVRINSPGGSPVQAGYINKEIRRLREEHPDIPVYAVITDIGASGGYYVAVAAEKIYADESSVVGSIGVLMNGFGFVEAMEKLGVERRLLTAGEHKDMLDPFSPVNPKELAHVKSLLEDIHQQFIEVVKEGRGERLAGDEKIFSGLIWTGEQSLELGLVDALGSSSYVAREVLGVEEIVDYTPRRDLLERVSERIGAALADTLALRMGLSALHVQ